MTCSSAEEEPEPRRSPEPRHIVSASVPLPVRTQLEIEAWTAGRTLSAQISYILQCHVSREAETTSGVSDGDHVAAPQGMPRLKAEQGQSREMLGRWMSGQFEAREAEYADRIEVLRNSGEHPSPLCSRMVKHLAAMGTSVTEIALLMQIAVGTLQKHYADELMLGPVEANTAVAETMFSIAIDRDHPACAKVAMFWLDRRGGEEWRRPTKKIEVAHKDAAPRTVDSSKFTREERQQLRDMIERIHARIATEEIEPKALNG